jgi:hypothetical protein
MHVVEVFQLSAGLGETRVVKRVVRGRRDALKLIKNLKITHPKQRHLRKWIDEGYVIC